MQSHILPERESIEDGLITRQQSERLARLKKIQEQGSAEHSVAWYITAWNMCAAPVALGMEGLHTLLTLTSPAAVALSWYRAYGAYKKKQNLPLHLSVALLSTTLLVTGASLLAPVIPFVAIGVFAAFGLYGISQCGKHLYRAWKAEDSEERWAHIKQAGKQLVNIAVNSLALFTSYVFGITISNAVNKLNKVAEDIADAFSKFDFAKVAELKTVAENLLSNVKSAAKTATQLFVGLTATVVIGAATETVKMNKETIDYIRHPSKIWNEIKARPRALPKMIVMASVRLVALAVTGIPQLLGLAAKNVALRVWNFFSKKSEQPVISVAPQKTMTPRSSSHRKFQSSLARTTSSSAPTRTISQASRFIPRDSSSPSVGRSTSSYFHHDEKRGQHTEQQRPLLMIH